MNEQPLTLAAARRLAARGTAVALASGTAAAGAVDVLTRSVTGALAAGASVLALGVAGALTGARLGLTRR